MVLSFLKNDYTKWSLIVLAGSLLASFLNYGFTLIMGRMLSQSSFGEVSAIFGLMVILVAPTQAISNYVSRHISFLAGKKDYLTARVWLWKVSRSVFYFSLILLLVFWLLIPPLSRFLGINFLPLIVFSFSLPFAFMLSVYAGALQGLKSFKAFSFQNILGAMLKLSLAVIFVYIGLFAPGVMLAMAVSLASAYFYNYTKIKSFWKRMNLEERIETRPSGTVLKNIFSKSFLAVFLAALLVALISNIDVILVKHFLEPDLAGEYAALSAIGKILIYVASAFVTVMFAMVSESFAERKTHAEGPERLAPSAVEGSRGAEQTFKNTLVYISALSLPAVLAFGLAPKIVVEIFFGSNYINIAPYLPIFSVAMFLFSLSIAFIHYFLAIRNNSFLLPFAAGALLQIVLISFHHKNIENVVASMLWSSIFLLVALVVNHFLYRLARAPARIIDHS